MTSARVTLWGTTVGAVTWIPDRELGVFQYQPEFLASGIQLSPLMMPLAEFPYEFPALARNTFKGLPGLLADSLPDRYGNAVIDAWLAEQGRSAASFHSVERLCYLGSRGMGALEFEPQTVGPPTQSAAIEVEALVILANEVLDERSKVGGAFSGADDRKAIEDIIRVGTSAGGARAKAILAWNPETNEFRSGQVEAGDGFEQWLMKFDGISNNRDKEIADPQGYGRIEYAYYLMARRAGIEMNPCRLHEEGGRAHFMTKRFDRTTRGGKRHMQSLGSLAHFDYNQPAAYSYEQAIDVIRRLRLPFPAIAAQVRRALFNVVARNQDDHVKNIAFLMNRRGEWSLSPAFDVSFNWNPGGAWTGKHQMSLRGKRDGFERGDLLEFALSAGVKKAAAKRMLDEINSAIHAWPELAEEADVPSARRDQIARLHRLP